MTVDYKSKLFSLSGRNYTRLEDIRQDLLSGVVKGALVDSYVAAERKDLFDDPALYIHQVRVKGSPPFRGHMQSHAPEYSKRIPLVPEKSACLREVSADVRLKM